MNHSTSPSLAPVIVLITFMHWSSTNSKTSTLSRVLFVMELLTNTVTEQNAKSSPSRERVQTALLLLDSRDARGYSYFNGLYQCGISYTALGEIRTFDKNVRIVRTNFILTFICCNMGFIRQMQNVRILV